MPKLFKKTIIVHSYFVAYIRVQERRGNSVSLYSRNRVVSGYYVIQVSACIKIAFVEVAVSKVILQRVV